MVAHGREESTFILGLPLLQTLPAAGWGKCLWTLHGLGFAFTSHFRVLPTYVLCALGQDLCLFTCTQSFAMALMGEAPAGGRRCANESPSEAWRSRKVQSTGSWASPVKDHYNATFRRWR